MMTKACFKCGEMKPLSEFYVHKKMGDGTLNKCKACTREDVRRNRRESPNARLYDQRRVKTEKRKKLRASVRDRWREANPEKYRAQTAVYRAVRKGILVRGKCEECGDPNVHAHHDDYSKPLEVRWLCPLHHHRHHAPKKTF